ncbi:hypothetical protein DPMN_037232 [Dreissena polymorpha]|uniref:Uncharacterized protein n=1 Tax=Dreissena polymorpha TaxID=45954 RepID=A0A9D4RM54_DREPO|nr:hypothetical protein DPMN_037232 [Dreissena polymorpha]
MGITGKFECGMGDGDTVVEILFWQVQKTIGFLNVTATAKLIRPRSSERLSQIKVQRCEAETNKGENCRSAPAQSTSIDIELAQQPHESRLQEPQSRATLPLP